MHSTLSSWISALIILLLSGLGGLATPLADARGEDIYFRGPISAIGRDADGTIVEVTVQVNRAQAHLSLNAWTQLVQARGFPMKRGDLKLGDFLEVSGYFTRSGKIVAYRIHLESADAVTAEGRITDLGLNSITVNGIEFQAGRDSLIRAAGSEEVATISALAVGELVRLRATYTQGALIISELEYGARTVETEPLRFEGIISNFDGALMEIDVGLEAFGALVAVDTETEILGTASPGEFVQVEGKFLPGTGLVRASQITTDDNSNGNLYDDWADDSEAAEIELEGPIEDLSIAGGSGWIIVNGTLVHVTPQTDIEFDEEVEATTSALAVGQYVEVNGDFLPDGSVQAREIDIESDDENEEGEEQEEGDEGEDGEEDDESDDDDEADEVDEGDDSEEDEEGDHGEDREDGEDPTP